MKKRKPKIKWVGVDQLRYNILAENVVGNFKGKTIEIILGKHPYDSVVKINGKKIDNCINIVIQQSIDKSAIVTLTLMED